jgi:hypothetical protein
MKRLSWPLPVLIATGLGVVSGVVFAPGTGVVAGLGSVALTLRLLSAREIRRRQL